MHLVDMITLLILLSLGRGYPIPGARISHGASEEVGDSKGPRGTSNPFAISRCQDTQ
jgi:hypothetical protein